MREKYENMLQFFFASNFACVWNQICNMRLHVKLSTYLYLSHTPSFIPMFAFEQKILNTGSISYNYCLLLQNNSAFVCKIYPYVTSHLFLTKYFNFNFMAQCINHHFILSLKITSLKLKDMAKSILRNPYIKNQNKQNIRIVL